jgi:ABC-type transporter Mla subunit MlaD
MTTEDRFERIDATLEKLSYANAATQANLDRLTQVTATFAASAAAHDDQIEKLILAAEINRKEWEQLRREFHAYLTTIHPRQ